MAKRKTPKRLFKNPDRISSYQHDRSQVRGMKEMARERADVLQNIEFAVVQAYKENPRVDDRIVREALRAHLGRTAVDDPRVADLVEKLDAMRQFREDISDDVWREAIGVIDDSVGRHSGFLPGETAYLRFVSEFID